MNFNFSFQFPKDGIVHRAGYCNMSAPRPMVGNLKAVV